MWCYLDTFLSLCLSAFTSHRNMKHVILHPLELSWSVLVVSLVCHKTMKLSGARFLLYMKEMSKVANDFKITSIW